MPTKPWNSVNSTPLYKSGNSQKPMEYRPARKEKKVISCTTRETDLISDNQFGFGELLQQYTIYIPDIKTAFKVKGNLE